MSHHLHGLGLGSSGFVERRSIGAVVASVVGVVGCAKRRYRTMGSLSGIFCVKLKSSQFFKRFYCLTWATAWIDSSWVLSGVLGSAGNVKGNGQNGDLKTQFFFSYQFSIFLVHNFCLNFFNLIF
jgi:hypothetical protein